MIIIFSSIMAPLFIWRKKNNRNSLIVLYERVQGTTGCPSEEETTIALFLKDPKYQVQQEYRFVVRVPVSLVQVKIVFVLAFQKNSKSLCLPFHTTHQGLC